MADLVDKISSDFTRIARMKTTGEIRRDTGGIGRI